MHQTLAPPRSNRPGLRRLTILRRHAGLPILRDCDCEVEAVSATEVAVEIPGSPTPLAAEMELRVYLTAWRIRHADVGAEIVYET
jgi:hypothetical protein